MINKNFLKPGMLVELRNGELCIVAIDNDSIGRNELMLCWNDKTGRCLFLNDYNNDLTYRSETHNEMSIDVIYDLGSFVAPFNMNKDERNLIWSRDKFEFSIKEILMATHLSNYIKTIMGITDCSKIFLTPMEEFDQIVISGPDISMSIPGNRFPNLDKRTSLTSIMQKAIGKKNGSIL